MTLPLDAAVDALWQAVLPAAGVSVTYTQGATSVTADAVPGSTPFESQTIDGLVRTDRTQDFTFRTAYFTLTPRRGDVIVWGDRKFEVIQPAGNRCYTYLDTYERLIRVYAKEINAS